MVTYQAVLEYYWRRVTTKKAFYWNTSLLSLSPLETKEMREATLSPKCKYALWNVIPPKYHRVIYKWFKISFPVFVRAWQIMYTSLIKVLAQRINVVLWGLRVGLLLSKLAKEMSTHIKAWNEPPLTFIRQNNLHISHLWKCPKDGFL